jgi:hypothetical protein
MVLLLQGKEGAKFFYAHLFAIAATPEFSTISRL